MKAHIREKIKAALAAAAKAPASAAQPLDPTADRPIVEAAVTTERFWTVDEIAARVNLDYTTVYRALKARPGWLRFGRAIRVTDELYRQFLREGVNRGLTDRK